MKKFELTMVFTLVIATFAGLFSISSFASSCDSIRDEVLRLHVLANSDSDEDQALKLKVRDAVLEEGAEIFDGAKDVLEAQAGIEAEQERLREIAVSVVVAEGYDYPVTVSLEREYFNTRTYDGVTLPAGEYAAVRIVIGSGAGENWWCVMFPPMCLPAAESDASIDAVLDEDEVNIVESDPQYEVRFKIVEVVEELKQKWRRS